MSPPIISIGVGVLLGIINPVRNALFNDFTVIAPIGSALLTIAQPIVCLNCLIMSASLASVKIFSDKKESKEQNEVKYSNESQPQKNTAVGPHEDLIVPSTVCGYEGLQNHDDVDDSPDAVNNISSKSNPHKHDHEESPHSYTDYHSADGVIFRPTELDLLQGYKNTHFFDEGLGRKRSQTEPNLSRFRYEYLQKKSCVQKLHSDVSVSDTKECIPTISENTSLHSLNLVKHQIPANTPTVTHTPPKYRTVAAAILCRLILAPLLVLPIVYACIKTGFVSQKDRIFMLVVVLEAAAPSAQMMIIALSQLGLEKVASQISYIFMIQYSLAIITITIWTTVAIYILYQ